MHTLVTQMRVRRLLRLHAAEVDRMRHGTMPRRVRSAAVRKLLDASASVRAGWAAEMAAVEPGATGGRSTAGTSRTALAGLQPHLHRNLLAAETAIANPEHAGAGPARHEV